MNYVTHPRIAPGRVEERRYQSVMVEGCLRENTLVILPTGLGKTMVALSVAAEYLSKGKVLILAPTKPLVEQHMKVFSDLLVDTRIAMLNGGMPPARRAALVESSELVVSTPQTVSNDLDEGRYDLDKFSLIVYDEAHRGVGDYAYVNVAAYRAKGTRSIGMTASPGSNIARIEEVCRNLDLRRIDIRSDDDPDVAPYVHDTYVNRIEVNLPDDLADIVALLRAMLDAFTANLSALGFLKRDAMVSTKSLIALGQNMQIRVSQGEKTATIFRALSLQAMCIKVLHAINLAETQGVTALRQYMSKLESESRQAKGGRGAKEIVNRPEYDAVRKIVERTNVEHPKVSRVMSIVSRVVTDEERSSKVLVFTQFRDTCDMLEKKIAIIPGARVGKLIGQANGGLKQREQKDILDRFRSGELNVIVATSVGEEGLDVSSTDAVVFYEPIPSEIRTIQRRGRTGRKNDGEVYILVAKGTMDEIAERSSSDKEDAMRARLERLGRQLGRGPSFVADREQTGLYDFHGQKPPFDDERRP